MVCDYVVFFFFTINAVVCVFDCLKSGSLFPSLVLVVLGMGDLFFKNYNACSLFYISVT
jgi:hypothetical protein